jgi:hypothetical protein
MNPRKAFTTQAGAWAEFEHPRAVLFVDLRLSDDGSEWLVTTTGYVVQWLDREPVSVSDREPRRFASRAEAAEAVAEIVLEVGAMADRAAAGVLIAA